MRVVVSPTWTVVTRATASEDMVAERALSRSNPRYFFAKNKQFVKKRLSVFVSGIKYRKFPTGLLPDVEKALKKYKRKLIIEKDTRKTLKWVEPREDMIPGITLDLEQVKGTKALLQQRAAFLEGITGFGKTETMLSAFECLWQAQPITGLLIVTQAEMFDQTVERAHLRLGAKRVHVIREDKEELPKHGLVITTYQTLKNRLFGGTTTKIDKRICKCGHPPRSHQSACAEKKCKCKKFAGMRRKAKVQHSKKVRDWCQALDLVMLDEIQLLTGDYLDTMKVIQASYRLGFSATPKVEGDAMRMLNLRGWVGSRAFLVNEKRQVDIGRIALTHVWWRLVGMDDPLPVSFDMRQKGAYSKAFRASVLRYTPFVKEVVKAAKWAHDNGLQVLVKVGWVEHAQFLEKMLKSVLPEEVVGRLDATIPKQQRKETRAGFEAGRIKVLVGNKVVGVGIDFQNLHLIINAEMGKARHSLYQAIGRGLRKKKTRANILYVVHILNGRHKRFMVQSIKTIASYKRKEKKGVYVLHYQEPLELVA